MTIDARSQGGNVIIATKYGGGRGGGVDYTLLVPAGASVAIDNVTGTVDIVGVLGNVSATTQTGEIRVQLGRVAGNRVVDLGATTGSVTLSIARDSSARVNAGSTVGSFSTDFAGISRSQTNVVGVVASGNIGTGSAAIRLHATTGSIALRALR
ncbi:MAG: hypothetical protein JO092_12055 [Candidatus Eremiobacteraeota bacterium]|nr:hypothetical protein [Candidatus Eremiobacteraeota bacterium]